MVKEIKSRFDELGGFLRAWWSSKETCQQARKQLEKTIRSKRFLQRMLGQRSGRVSPV